MPINGLHCAWHLSHKYFYRLQLAGEPHPSESSVLPQRTGRQRCVVRRITRFEL